MRRIILIFTLVHSLISYSQKSLQEIDSILKSVEQENDSIWFSTYQKVGFNSIFSFREKAPEIIKKGLHKALKKKDKYWETKFTYFYGVHKDVNGEFDSSLVYFKRTFEKAEKHNYPKLKLSAINGLGMNYRGRGNYEKALEYYFKALEQNELTGEERLKSKFLGNIGTVYQEMNLFDKSLDYTKQAFELEKKYNNLDGMVSRYNMLAILSFHKEDYKEAENYALSGIKLAKEVNMSTGNLDDTLAIIYMGKREMDKAIPLLKSLIANHENGSYSAGAKLQPIINIINSYNSINQPKNALTYVNKGKAVIASNPEVDQMAENFYFNAADTYYLLRFPLEAEELKNKGHHIKDSIFSVSAANNMAEIETKYNLADKERNLAETRANLAESEVEVKNRNFYILGITGLALLLGLIGYTYYYRQKQKNIRLQKETELKTAFAKIETQNKLQEQRLRISRDLHDNIGSQLTFVTSSIDNLKYRIKGKDNTVENKLQDISEFTTNTIYELRDTIWAMNKTKITFDDLQSRIANFIEKAGNASDTVNFSLQISEAIHEDSSFTSIVGMHIYRIIQEAVNNALKYANPTNISVSFNALSNGYKIAIIDDGKGFDMDTIDYGNGIRNMKKRANEIGSALNMKSIMGQGTEIDFVV